MRTVGALNISVGTSLAFEMSGPPVLKKADSLLINLRTIVRNVIEAYEATDNDRNDPLLVSKAVEEDLKNLASYLNELNLPRALNFVVFNPSYKSLEKTFPNAKLWEPRTDLQKAKFALTNKVIGLILKDYGSIIVNTDVSTPEFTGNGIIVTHHPVDLVLTKSQNRLMLLESYTGSVKPHTMWFTKLTGDDKLFNMPLNKLTIQIFGDKSINFRSESFKIKQLVEDIAKKGEWNSGSSIEKVRGSINIHASGFDKSSLLSLL